MEWTHPKSTCEKLICSLFKVDTVLEFTQCSCAAHNQYLSQYFHDDWHHSILFGEALIGHVSSSSLSADEDVSTSCFKGNIFHVRPNPAVSLPKHGLGSQGCSHQEDVFALHTTFGKRGLYFINLGYMYTHT